MAASDREDSAGASTSEEDNGSLAFPLPPTAAKSERRSSGGPCGSTILKTFDPRSGNTTTMRGGLWTITTSATNDWALANPEEPGANAIGSLAPFAPVPLDATVAITASGEAAGVSMLTWSGSDCFSLPGDLDDSDALFLSVQAYGLSTGAGSTASVAITDTDTGEVLISWPLVESSESLALGGSAGTGVLKIFEVPTSWSSVYRSAPPLVDHRRFQLTVSVTKTVATSASTIMLAFAAPTLVRAARATTRSGGWSSSILPRAPRGVALVTYPPAGAIVPSGTVLIAYRAITESAPAPNIRIVIDAVPPSRPRTPPNFAALNATSSGVLRAPIDPGSGAFVTNLSPQAPGIYSLRVTDSAGGPVGGSSGQETIVEVSTSTTANRAVMMNATAVAPASITPMVDLSDYHHHQCAGPVEVEEPGEMPEPESLWPYYAVAGAFVAVALALGLFYWWLRRPVTGTAAPTGPSAAPPSRSLRRRRQKAPSPLAPPSEAQAPPAAGGTQ